MRKDTTLDIQPSWGFRCLQSQVPADCNPIKDSKWELLAEPPNHRTVRNINMLFSNSLHFEVSYAAMGNQAKNTWNISQQRLGYILNLTHTCTHTPIYSKIFWEKYRQYNHPVMLSVSGFEPIWLLMSVCNNLKTWKVRGWLVRTPNHQDGPTCLLPKSTELSAGPATKIQGCY